MAQPPPYEIPQDVPPSYTEATTQGSQVQPVTGNAMNYGSTGHRETSGNGPIGFQQPPELTTQGGTDGGNSGASVPEQSIDVYDEVQSQEYDEYRVESYVDCREASN